MIKKTRATFDWVVDKIYGQDVIMIIDLNRGMSVTNDIENVVQYIAAVEGIDPKKYIIIYKDSERVWDGWSAKTWNFMPLRCEDGITAVKEYIDRYGPPVETQSK